MLGKLKGPSTNPLISTVTKLACWHLFVSFSSLLLHSPTLLFVFSLSFLARPPPPPFHLLLSLSELMLSIKMEAVPQLGDECELSFAEAVTLAYCGVWKPGPQLLQTLQDGLCSHSAACWLCCCNHSETYMCVPSCYTHAWTVTGFPQQQCRRSHEQKGKKNTFFPTRCSCWRDWE